MSSPAPIKPHSAWLKQVGLDLALSAVAQVIAVVLADCADPGTDIVRVGASALAEPTGMKAAQVREALTLLVDRGHLRSLSLRGSAEAFQFVRRPRPITRRTRAPKASLQVFPFPPARQHNLVREIVAEMLIRPRQAAETWLQAELLKQRRALHRKGFPKDVVDRECKTLEAAVRRGLWRAVLVPDEPA
jgi:hypothetical protein